MTLKDNSGLFESAVLMIIAINVVSVALWAMSNFALCTFVLAVEEEEVESM